MRRVVAGGAGYLATGVGASAAEVEVLDRRAVVGPAGERAAGHHLLRNHVHVPDVAVGQADAVFDVLGVSSVQSMMASLKFGA